jgi:hypothetical protein
MCFVLYEIKRIKPVNTTVLLHIRARAGRDQVHLYLYIPVSGTYILYIPVSRAYIHVHIYIKYIYTCSYLNEMHKYL